jgi:hypothetical protein
VLVPLAITTLTTALAASESDRASELAKRKALARALSSRFLWHFAMSHDWNSYGLTVRAPFDIRDPHFGDRYAREKYEEWVRGVGGDPEDDRERFYALVRGGKVYQPRQDHYADARGGATGDIIHREHTAPPGTPVIFVFQAERDIGVVTLDASEAPDLPALKRLAQERSNEVVRWPDDELFEPELIVVGGSLVQVGNL